jgi:hypothetical protein
MIFPFRCRFYYKKHLCKSCEEYMLLVGDFNYDCILSSYAVDKNNRIETIKSYKNISKSERIELDTLQYELALNGLCLISQEIEGMKLRTGGKMCRKDSIGFVKLVSKRGDLEGKAINWNENLYSGSSVVLDE